MIFDFFFEFKNDDKLYLKQLKYTRETFNNFNDEELWLINILVTFDMKNQRGIVLLKFLYKVIFYDSLSIK